MQAVKAAVLLTKWRERAVPGKIWKCLGVHCEGLIVCHMPMQYVKLGVAHCVERHFDRRGGQVVTAGVNPARCSPYIYNMSDQARADGAETETEIY
jgi:hypothetical protein